MKICLGRFRAWVKVGVKNDQLQVRTEGEYILIDRKSTDLRVSLVFARCGYICICSSSLCYLK